jgi:hypothetical protein
MQFSNNFIYSQDSSVKRSMKICIVKYPKKIFGRLYPIFKRIKVQGWIAKFFEQFLDIVGDDLHRVVEEVRTSGKLMHCVNSTVIAAIPQTNCPSSFNYFCPIALYNCLYKIISKIIAIRIKFVLSNIITLEQFNFLKGSIIQEVIGMTKEGLHSIKIHKCPVLIIKIDPSKDYDRIFMAISSTSSPAYWL